LFVGQIAEEVNGEEAQKETMGFIDIGLPQSEK